MMACVAQAQHAESSAIAADVGDLRRRHPEGVVMRRSSAPLVGMMIAVALVTMFRPGAVSSLQGDTVLAATLSGAEEVPDPGDPDGSGTATVVLRSASGEVCW